MWWQQNKCTHQLMTMTTNKIFIWFIHWTYRTLKHVYRLCLQSHDCKNTNVTFTIKMLGNRLKRWFFKGKKELSLEMLLFLMDKGIQFGLYVSTIRNSLMIEMFTHEFETIFSARVLVNNRNGKRKKETCHHQICQRTKKSNKNIDQIFMIIWLWQNFVAEKRND